MNWGSVYFESLALSMDESVANLAQALHSVEVSVLDALGITQRG